MVLARLLADEGAELRHSEVMELYLRAASDRPYDSMFFLSLLDTADLTDNAQNRSGRWRA